MGTVPPHTNRVLTLYEQARRQEDDPYPNKDFSNNLAGWDGQNDIRHPRNWRLTLKLPLLTTITALAFMSTCTASVPSLILSRIIHFGSMPKPDEKPNDTADSFIVTSYMLGLAIGSLIISPLTDAGGRRHLLFLSSILFSTFASGCAAANHLYTLVFLRFFAGLFAAVCLNVGCGHVIEMFAVQHRAKAIAFYSLPVFVAPPIGAFFGLRVEKEEGGWIWVFQLWCILLWAVTFVSFFDNHETNPATLMNDEIFELQKIHPNLQNPYRLRQGWTTKVDSVMFRRALWVPWKLLGLSRIVTAISLYLAALFGIVYLLSTSVPEMYVSTYGWRDDIATLVPLGVGVGSILAAGFVAFENDRRAVILRSMNNNVYQPEMRLPLCLLFGIMVPSGIFLYTWSIHYHSHWFVPILGLALVGLGITGLYIPFQVYLVESFPFNPAAAMGVVTALRWIAAASLSYAGPALYGTLGNNWGNTLLGFIALALVPFPSLIHRHGVRIRRKYNVRLMGEPQRRPGSDIELSSTA
ncbi:MFS general substrate transporter [Sporormia fimetaria CBS 119925]|uniref:MFS general substrate transporter n=1 Tax=Sporormia fimetaria CBS 119925 TaxID=1340428 RepID=A0A6A6V6T2_9PLEO|nr:MFS general substrate transporter [Sporormia fimetaria CBS 119925]